MAFLIRPLLLCLSIAFATHIAYNLYRRKKIKNKKDVNEVIMFSHGATGLHKSLYCKSLISKNFDRLLHYLNTPKHTLDLCIYVLTNIDLAKTVLKMHYKGVKVRVIIDADMAYSAGSYIRRLDKNNIPIRCMKSPNLMHHKFCLIDASFDDSSATPLVMIGSLNWTNQALFGNWENVAVTSQKDLVNQYRVEFERLWEMFPPIVN